eukprot:6188908-Pleurochrysis_carterae.AAC.4
MHGMKVWITLVCCCKRSAASYVSTATLTAVNAASADSWSSGRPVLQKQRSGAATTLPVHAHLLVHPLALCDWVAMK